jgi:hypothetical protein
MVFHISPPAGQTDLIPGTRQYQLIVYGIHQPEAVQVRVNGRVSPCHFAYDEERKMLVIEAVELSTGSHLTVELTRPGGLLTRRDGKVERARMAVSRFRTETMAKADIFARMAEITADLTRLANFSTALTPSQIQCLLEILLEAGAYRITGAGRDNTWLLWNNNGDERAAYLYVRGDANSWSAESRFTHERGTISRTKLVELAAGQELTVKLADWLIKIG